MLEHILDGGTIMFPLLLLSILAFAVIIDRIRAFRLAENDVVALRKTVTDHLYSGNIDESIEACEKSSGPVAAVLIVGLQKFRKLISLNKPMSEIELSVNKTMGDYAPHVVETLEKRMNLLTMIAAVAPLLGMTGTVTGMISSFDSMASAGMDAAAVSGGISEALVTTAAGLIVAIPAVVAYNIFVKKVDRIVLAIEESATEVVDLIAHDYDIENSENS
jgi:biopolymer transport protein ExbB